VEATLAEIWAELLNIERVGRGDNFFDLGGHSLLAVQVVARMRQALGMDVVLADLFSHPTVASLTARLQGAERRSDADQAIPVRSTGSERPLFLVHEGAGSVAYAQVLHPHIDAGIPVYALPAAPAGEHPLRTVEEMAMRLVRMIREVQPTGPYRLAGWSFGGLLAYEIAAQLIGQGQAVEFLGMMDTHYLAGAAAGAGDARRDYPLLLRMLSMEQGVETVRGAALAELEIAAGTMELAALVTRCHETGVLPEQVTVEQVQGMQDRLQAHRGAARGYAPQPIPVFVHLFPARQSPGSDPRCGWQNLFPDTSIRVTPVPGTHLSMMEAENIVALGEALSREIRRAAERRGVPPEVDGSRW
jgi:thioesterase domain-containing protein/aryl carrier-like protein